MKHTNTIIASSFLFTLGIFLFSTLFPSLIAGPHPAFLRVDNGFLNSIWQLHQSHPAFAGRPLTNIGIGILHNYFSVPVGWSFVLINFTLLFLCGILLYKLTKELRLDDKESLWSLIIFYTSFTILLAFFRSIDTYDDLWQYVFILASFLLIRTQRWYYSVPLIFLACLARETTLFLLPGLFIITTPSPLTNLKSKILNQKFILFLVPCILYILVEQLILNHYGLLEASKVYAEQTRFTHWQFNFQNLQFAIETFVSMILVFAVPKLFIWTSYRLKKLTDIDKKYITAAIITFLINTPIVLIAGRAREARLLALPLLFVWPQLGRYATTLWQSLKFKPKRLLLISCFIFLSFLFSFFVYKPTFSAGFDWGFQTYCFITLVVVAGYFALSRRS